MLVITAHCKLTIFKVCMGFWLKSKFIATLLFMKPPQMHRLASQASDRARDSGWCTGPLLNCKHPVAMYRLRVLWGKDRESERLMATVSQRHGWIMSATIFTHLSFHIMFPLLNISWLNSCLLCTNVLFWYNIAGWGWVTSFRFSPNRRRWRLTSRLRSRRPDAHLFIVALHCLPLDKLQQLKVREKREPLT